jgi:acetoacetate decarboxylase
MGFVRSEERNSLKFMGTGEFYDMERLTVFFETKPEVVRRLLPPPLKPASLPIASVFVANYPKTNFGVTYLESALFLQAQFNGEEGSYCLGMPVNNDMAMVLGREIFGYPKKIANIHLKRDGEKVEGWTERHGVRFLEIRAKLTGKFNDKGVQDLMAASLQVPGQVVTYNFKYFPAPGGEGFDYNPRLIREVVTRRPKHVEMGEAELVLRSSKHDPWGDVEVVRVLGAVYVVGDSTMLPGSVVAEVDAAQFAPYALIKLDEGLQTK